MSCDTYFEKMSAWVDDALPAVEDLKEHLAHCVQCQTRYEELGMLRSVMREALDVAPSEAFAMRTAEKIQMQVARKTRTPRASLSDTARWLWGGLAWSLVAAGSTAGALSARYEMQTIQAGSEAPEVIRWFGLPINYEWVWRAAYNHWWSATLLLVLAGIGLWLLQPLRCWRRLPTLGRREVAWFGVRTWLAGVLPLLPAVMPEVFLTNPNTGLWMAWGWGSLWTVLSLGMTASLLMFRTARSVNHTFAAFALCLLLAAAIEPALTPPLLSPGYYGGPHTSLERAVLDHLEVGDGPFIPEDLQDGTRVWLTNPVPDWMTGRLAAIPDLVTLTELWPGLLGGLLFIGLAGAAVVAGRGGWRPVVLASLPVVGAALALQGLGMVGRPPAYSAATRPHPDLARTAVCLTDHRLLADPEPGLVQQLLQDTATNTTPWNLFWRSRLLETKAMLEWDPVTQLTWMEQDVDRNPMEWLMRRMSVGWRSDLKFSFSTTRPADPGKVYCPLFRETALRWSGRHGLWLVTNSDSLLPPVTGHLRGRVLLDGHPLGNVPVRLLRAPYNDSDKAVNPFYGESREALQACLEQNLWSSYPLAMRTDADGRFDFNGPPPDMYLPMVLLSGNWRGTVEGAPHSSVNLGSQDVNLGDIRLHSLVVAP